MILNQLLASEREVDEGMEIMASHSTIDKDEMLSESVQNCTILRPDIIEILHQEITKKSQQFDLFQHFGGFTFEGIVHVDPYESHYRVTTEELGDIGRIYSVNICTIQNTSKGAKKPAEKFDKRPFNTLCKSEETSSNGPIDYSSPSRKTQSSIEERDVSVTSDLNDITSSEMDLSITGDCKKISSSSELNKNDTFSGPIDYSSKVTSLSNSETPSQSVNSTNDEISVNRDETLSSLREMRVLMDAAVKKRSINSARPSSSGLSRRKGGDIVNVFLCPFCVYCCLKKGELKKHYRAAHLDGKPYGCPHCPYRSTHKSTLRAHVMSKHTGERPYECPYPPCDYKASQKGLVDKHIMTKHTGEKPFKCEYCDFSSSHSSTVKTHVMFKHTGEKPFECPHCDYRAVQRGHVDRHIRAVHTGEKPFQCPHCEYRACRNANIQKHVMSVHKREKPYGCPYCDFKSSHKGNVSSHIISKHTEVKPYECTLCDYKSSCRTGLNRHLMKHTNVKKDRLSCHYCSYKSHRKDHLRTHVKYVHFKGRIASKEDQKAIERSLCEAVAKLANKQNKIIGTTDLLETSLEVQLNEPPPSTSNPD